MNLRIVRTWRAVVIVLGLVVGAQCKPAPPTGGRTNGQGGSLNTGGVTPNRGGGSTGTGGMSTSAGGAGGAAGQPADTGTRAMDVGGQDVVGAGVRDASLDVAADGVGPGAIDAPGTVSVEPPGPWARNLRVGVIEATQAVFVKIGEGDTIVPPAQRNAPLIEGRPLLVRAHVAVDAGFVARRLRAVLTLDVDGMPVGKWEEVKMIRGSSTADALDATFNILVPAASVLPKATMWVAVYEAGPAMGAEPALAPRFPSSGSADLAIKAGRMELDIVFVPAYFTKPIGDSPERRKRVENFFYDVYPVQKLNLVFHEPVKLQKRMTSTNEGFALLRDLRTKENAKGWEYYALLVAEADATVGGGVANLVTSASLSAGPQRISYNRADADNIDDETTVVIMAHEVGHNHGRDHSPGCGAAGTDPAFPYAAAGIGVNGFSLSAMAIRPKAKYTDLMAYCFPKWVSDFTYGKFEARIRSLSATKVTTASHELLVSRSLQGFVSRDGQSNFGVALGTLVPEGTPVTSSRYAELHLAGGTQLRSAVSVTLLSDQVTREVAVNLPDDPNVEVVRGEIVVDGERFSVPASAFRDPE